MIDRTRVNDLPLNGRNAAKLTELVIGVVPGPMDNADQGVTKTFPVAVTVSVNGARTADTSYMFDGGNNIDEYTNVKQPFPFPDALQEISVQASNYNAESEAIKEIEKRQATINVIFATGASQLDMLDALTKIDNLPWAKVRGFHMDEYIGLPISHLASFRGYLREKLTEKVSLKEFNEVDGTAPRHSAVTMPRSYVPPSLSFVLWELEKMDISRSTIRE